MRIRDPGWRQFGSGIRDGKKSDPGSGINIPDPQHYRYNLKGIDRPFELRGESRLIRSVITNWMLGKFFYLILKGLHHKISKKPWDAA
jgi:hypothetical protein